MSDSAQAIAPRIDISHLDEVDQGDYGWVIVDQREGPRVLWYDDDESRCSCGNEDCWLFSEDPSEDHYEIWLAICYEKPEDLGVTGYWLIDGDLLYSPSHEKSDGGPPPLADNIDAALVARHAKEVGWIYMVQLLPDLAPNRIKVGFTSRDVRSRLTQFRCTNPECVVIGLWKAEKSDEKDAHDLIDGRIGRSEVFVVADVASAIGRLSQHWTRWSHE